MAKDDAEWGRLMGRLERAGARSITLGQCEHGYVASCRVPAGRTTALVEVHGEPSRVAAVDALATLALERTDGTRPKRPVKVKAKRKGRR